MQGFLWSSKEWNRLIRPLAYKLIIQYIETEKKELHKISRISIIVQW